ncbi:hypothetical protein J1N35_004628, partial [Gossypium stocksii]
MREEEGWMAIEEGFNTANETELDNLVCHLRKAIRKIDIDLITALQGDGGWLKYCECMKEI